MSFDLNSLYPHLIMQYNISPETLVANEKVKNMSVEKLLNKEVDTSILKDATMTPNGALFKTTQKGFFLRRQSCVVRARRRSNRRRISWLLLSHRKVWSRFILEWKLSGCPVNVHAVERLRVCSRGRY